MKNVKDEPKRFLMRLGELFVCKTPSISATKNIDNKCFREETKKA